MDALSSPAARRNRDPILAVLGRELPAAGTVLEIASGGGEHVVHFAAARPDLVWQPSDPDPAARASITAHARGQPAILPPLALDVTDSSGWPAGPFEAILAINLLHISPWAATPALMELAGTLLPPGGLLFLYGPFVRPDAPLEPSNAAFDGSLRLRDPRWGLRGLDAVIAAAAAQGLTHRATVPMPANNLSILFRRLHAPTPTR